MIVKFIMGFLIIAAILFSIGRVSGLYNKPAFGEMHASLCGAYGLTAETDGFDPSEKKEAAILCAAYHLGAYQLTGNSAFMDIFLIYGKKYKLTIQDIDSETWPTTSANTFLSDMQCLVYALANLTPDERARRIALWRVVADRHFKSCYDQGVHVVPAKLLKLVKTIINT